MFRIDHLQRRVGNKNLQSVDFLQKNGLPCRLFSTLFPEFYQTSAVQLATMIKSKKISCLQVMQATLSTIEIINPKINALVQHNFKHSLKQAEDSDRAIRSNSVTLGPLHGIPFTAKDVLESVDFVSSSGHKERHQYVPLVDATVIRIMKKAGAILIGKTNVPELGNGVECHNNLYGRTNNPHDLNRTPGGSSGGEAALIAAGGSFIGLGSDSGGSLRIPAHFCGICALKPTRGRVSSFGHFPAVGNALDPRTQIGPLARSVEDLELTFSLIAGNDWQDPYVIDMPIYSSRQVNLSQLKVAYFINCDNFHTTPETEEAMNLTVKFLSERVRSISEDCSQNSQEALELIYNDWEILNAGKTAHDYGEHLNRWDRYRKSMLKHSETYDVIICPVATKPAPLHKMTNLNDFVYTYIFSLLGWPVVTLRVGTSHDNLPINIQIAARPFREDIALRVALELESRFGPWPMPLMNH